MTNSKHYKRRRKARIRKGCSSKKRYGSEIAAMRAAIRFQQTWYRCANCGGWHLTSENSTGLWRKRTSREMGKATAKRPIGNEVISRKPSDVE